jgi:hypothetical protein
VPNETWLIQLCAQIFELPAQILSADRPGIFSDADVKSRLLMARETIGKRATDSQGGERTQFLRSALDCSNVDIASDSLPLNGSSTTTLSNLISRHIIYCICKIKPILFYSTL